MHKHGAPASYYCVGGKTHLPGLNFWILLLQEQDPLNWNDHVLLFTSSKNAFQSSSGCQVSRSWGKLGKHLFKGICRIALHCIGRVWWLVSISPCPVSSAKPSSRPSSDGFWSQLVWSTFLLLSLFNPIYYPLTLIDKFWMPCAELLLRFCFLCSFHQIQG